MSGVWCMFHTYLQFLNTIYTKTKDHSHISFPVVNYMPVHVKITSLWPTVCEKHQDYFEFAPLPLLLTSMVKVAWIFFPMVFLWLPMPKSTYTDQYICEIFHCVLDLEGQSHILFPIVDYQDEHVKINVMMLQSQDVKFQPNFPSMIPGIYLLSIHA